MKKTIVIIILSLTILLLVVIVIPSQHCPIFEDSVMPGLPNFLNSVWPSPYSQMSLMCYLISTNHGRGVEIGLAPGSGENPIMVKNSHSGIQLSDRVTLFVDGIKASSKSLKIIDDLVELMEEDSEGNVNGLGMSTNYEYIWTPLMLFGKHNAKIEILQDAGGKVTYTWTFWITFF